MFLNGMLLQYHSVEGICLGSGARLPGHKPCLCLSLIDYPGVSLPLYKIVITITPAS